MVGFLGGKMAKKKLSKKYSARELAREKELLAESQHRDLTESELAELMPDDFMEDYRKTSADIAESQRNILRVMPCKPGVN
jgi:hypothetical protein